HGSARVRELRRAGRLRTTGAHGRVGERQDCHCALLPFLARDQTESRGGARRGGLPDLFRPARGWFLSGRYFPRGAVSPAGWRATRERGGHRSEERRVGKEWRGWWA